MPDLLQVFLFMPIWAWIVAVIMAILILSIVAHRNLEFEGVNFSLGLTAFRFRRRRLKQQPVETVPRDIPNRAEIVSWARQVARIEKLLEDEFKQAKPLTDSITSRRPTERELGQLNAYNNRITALCNQLIAITVPVEARTVHEKYVENYVKVADSIRYYVLAVRMNNLPYFDKSVIAAQDANRIGTTAYNEFEALLKRYSISCREIDFCE